MPAADPASRAQALVSAVLARAPHPRVVEAGCGARSHLTYPASARVTGIDILRTQLRRNAGSALAQGDVARLPIATGAADVVVCWDVLEHLPAPDTAIREIARVLRPGGLAVLALPNILSLKGLVTRFTPWRFHVWVYRRVLGDASVGTDAFDQFPTTLSLVLRPARLRRTAKSIGLRVTDLRLYEGPVPVHLRRRYRAADVALSCVSLVTRLVSAGRYDATLSDVILVLAKPDEAIS